MPIADIFGFIAGSLTTGAFIPQAIKVFKTRETKDLSLGMFSMTTLGVACWLTFGILSNSLPVIIPNAVTLCLSMFVLFMKLRYG